MSDCQSSLCKMNGCMFPQACPNDRAPAADSRVCDACGEQQNVAGYCINKQCSRHGRRNDYLANDAPAAYAPAARDEDALDAKRWREIRKHLKRDTWAEDDEPAHNCTIVYFAGESIAWPGMFLTIEQVVDALATAALAATPEKR